jgi:hypothetical protein
MTFRVASAAIAALFVTVSALAAQELEGPANLPPPGFDGQQFVDNAGCAFARAGVSGNTVWVARVNQSRDQICGLAPTFGATAVAAAPAPVQAPAPRPVAAPAPAADPGMPIPTVASTVRAPTPAPAAAAPTEPRRLTLAQACEGRTGIQPDLRDARTGQPVDCGGTAPAATPAPASLTLADACARQAATGTRLIDSATGQPIACATTVATAPTAAEPRHLTLAAACAEQAARGVILTNATTGQPIACPGTTVATRPASAATVTTVAATVAQQQRIDPLSAATISGHRPVAATGPIRVGDPLSAETISGVVTQIHYGPPPGYEHVWTDGRLNPNRGLPEIQATVPVAAHPTTQNVSSMNAPQLQAVATGGFIQVGTYGDPANAARAEANLRALGLPVAVSTLTRDGRQLQTVAAGPIAAADLATALNTARAAGYSDAFIR